MNQPIWSSKGYVRESYVKKLQENVAAISGEFHHTDDSYKAFYDKYCDHIGGHTGIWTFCGEAAAAFTKIEEQHEVVEHNLDFEWLEVVHSFAERLYDFDPTQQQIATKLEELAEQCIADWKKSEAEAEERRKNAPAWVEPERPDDDDEEMNCDSCVRTTREDGNGLATKEKYFSETDCGIMLCDWCREVHVQNCEECKGGDRG